MASYQRNPMFGQAAYDENAGWAYDTGWSDYSMGSSSVPYTNEPEGTGSAAGWQSIVAGGIGLATSIVDAVAGQQQVGAQPVYMQAPPVTQLPAPGTMPGTVSAVGNISSNVLLIGGLGLAALFFFRKK